MSTRISRRQALALMSGTLAGLSVQAVETTQTKRYRAADDLFPNPDRGFHGRANPPGGGAIGQQEQNHPPLSAQDLRALRDEPERMSLLRWCIIIPKRFWTEPISDAFIAEIQSSFDAAREAGIKLIPRFHYDWGMTNRDPEERIVRRHLDELGPFAQKNSDVIAWLQAGIFGGTGEGCASDSGYIQNVHEIGTTKWQGLSESGARLLKHWLEILPRNRMMTVRYPRLKWDLFGWAPADALKYGLTKASALDNSNPARVGFMNDGFMGSETHYAMFVLPGEMAFAEQDTGFVLSEGEISDDTEWKLAPGRVVREMTRLHQTSLNRDGDGWARVSAAWKKNGDYDEVTRRLGYRLSLVQTELPEQCKIGQSAMVKLTLTNHGFSRVLNPRKNNALIRIAVENIVSPCIQVKHMRPALNRRRKTRSRLPESPV